MFALERGHDEHGRRDGEGPQVQRRGGEAAGTSCHERTAERAETEGNRVDDRLRDPGDVDRSVGERHLDLAERSERELQDSEGDPGRKVRDAVRA